MAAVGACIGKEYVVSVLLASALAGGLLAIIYIVFRQGGRKTLANIVALVCFRLTSALQPHPVLNVHDKTTLRVPFGVAIAIGTLCCAGNALWWR
jgi:prepilin peptidase CpaA